LTAPQPPQRPRNLRLDALRVAVAVAVAALMSSLWLVSPAFADEGARLTEPFTKPSTKLPDPTYTLESVEIIGDTRTSPAVIVDTLDLRPGQPVNVSILREARLRLLATGYFRQAQFGMSPGSDKGRVILQITVEDRNTYLLSDLFIGSSRRSPFWGGLDIVDGNFLGYGQAARAAFVAGFDQYGFEVGWADPTLGASNISLAFRLHHLSGQERAFTLSPKRGLNPGDFFNLDYRRSGGLTSIGYQLHPLFGLFLDVEADAIHADSPNAELTAPFIRLGDSFVLSARLAAEFDNRDDPVMPRHGARAHLSIEGASASLASSYDYLKLLLQMSLALEAAPGHILRFDALGGWISGGAPFFKRFFIGDLNDLVPARSLGLNFSSRPASDFFNTGTDQLSYETIAMRAAVEYALPLVDRLDLFERVELFFSAGVYGATTPSHRREDIVLGIEPREGERAGFPLDLTLDLGVRLETSVGVFGLSFANGIALIPF
jgi:outer membrane protein insertion porin family